jgi:CheY-like chemotaxis protein
MPKILVVDNSLSVRRAVQRILEKRRVQVLCAASAGEAVEQIEREEPDVVVCDVIMPDKDGYQICEFVKTHPRLARTPVLLISGIVDTKVLNQAAKAQSNDVLRKPFSAEELMRKVDDLLAVSVNEAPGVPNASLEARVEPAPGEISPKGHSGPIAALDLRTLLEQFVAMPGVRLAALFDREGFLIESVGERGMEAQMAWALASSLAESSDGIGRELGHGDLHGVILEYNGGTVLLQSVGPAAMVGIVLRDAMALGKVRYSLKKTLPDLIGTL